MVADLASFGIGTGLGTAVGTIIGGLATYYGQKWIDHHFYREKATADIEAELRRRAMINAGGKEFLDRMQQVGQMRKDLAYDSDEMVELQKLTAKLQERPEPEPMLLLVLTTRLYRILIETQIARMAAPYRPEAKETWDFFTGLLELMLFVRWSEKFTFLGIGEDGQSDEMIQDLLKNCETANLDYVWTQIQASSKGIDPDAVKQMHEWYRSLKAQQRQPR